VYANATENDDIELDEPAVLYSELRFSDADADADGDTYTSVV